MRSTLIVDLDGTLAVIDQRFAYPDRAVNEPVARAVAAARDRYDVSVVTARGMRTHRGDLSAVERHVRPQVEAWLRRSGVGFDSVVVGKPWCGPRGFYLDDRAVHLEEGVFRFTGPFAGQPVEVHVGYVDEPFEVAHDHLVRLERWLDVVAYRFEEKPVPPVAAQDELVEPEATQAPWVLFVTGPGRVDPAGWFAFHHADLSAGCPGVVDPGSSNRAGFALVERRLFEEIGPHLDLLASALGSDGRPV